MPRTAQEIVDLLELEAIEDNLFRGRQPITMLQRVFGGQVAAQALVAATRTVEPHFIVHSLHSYFLRPGDTSVPIVFDVEELRDGRSFTTRRVIARQHGRPIYTMTASFQVTEEGRDHQDAMPDVPAPEDCPKLWGEELENIDDNDPDAEAWRHEWDALDVRLAGDSRPGGALEDPEHPARVRLWIRVDGDLGDDPVLHTAALTYASDLTLLGATLVPHDVMMSDPSVVAASLDHSVWFHRPMRTDRWWLYDQGSSSASGGRGLAFARVFAQDGTLCAGVAQEGLIRIAR